MKYKYYFEVVVCDRFCSSFIRNCDLGTDEYGHKATISFKTNTKPTKKNIEKICKILNSTKEEESLKQYYSNTTFLRCELVIGE